jgi:hypothetical protein
LGGGREREGANYAKDFFWGEKGPKWPYFERKEKKVEPSICKP